MKLYGLDPTAKPKEHFGNGIWSNPTKLRHIFGNWKQFWVSVGNWETCNHGGEGLIQRLGIYWPMGMLVAWAQGLLGRKRIGPLHMDFLWVISSARVGSEAVDSRVEDFASSLPALFTIYVLESARNARVRFRETQNHCLVLVSRCWSLWRYFRASTQENSSLTYLYVLFFQHYEYRRKGPFS